MIISKELFELIHKDGLRPHLKGNGFVSFYRQELDAYLHFRLNKTLGRMVGVSKPPLNEPIYEGLYEFNHGKQKGQLNLCENDALQEFVALVKANHENNHDEILRSLNRLR